MLPRLEAQEQLGFVDALLATEGQALPDEGRDAFLEKLRLRAEGLPDPEPEDATVRSLTEMGIQIVREPRPK